MTADGRLGSPPPLTGCYPGLFRRKHDIISHPYVKATVMHIALHTIAWTSHPPLFRYAHHAAESAAIGYFRHHLSLRRPLHDTTELLGGARGQRATHLAG